MSGSTLSTARLIAIMAPTLLLGGAIVSQYVGGLYPCEMCYWQRWPHLAAIGLALLAILLRNGPISRLLTLLAGIAILVSGAIGVFHAGVEYHWWEGLTRCSTAPLAGGSNADILANIMATPLIRCDQAQWTLGGISLAGFNALFSLAAAVAIFVLLSKRNVRR
jgi:disulfide bond formation protein DsbB